MKKMTDYNEIGRQADGLKVLEERLEAAKGTPGEAAAKEELKAAIFRLNDLPGMRPRGGKQHLANVIASAAEKAGLNVIKISNKTL